LMAIHKAPAASSPRCFFAAARTLDSGFWTNPIHTTTKYFYGFRLDRAPDRVPSPDATFSWSPDSGLWILDWAHSAYLPLPPSGRRTPDPGLRTPDPGLRTLDSGLRTPDSGLRTRDSPPYLLTYPHHFTPVLTSFLPSPPSLPLFFPSNSGPGTLNLRICFKVGDGAAPTQLASC